MSWRNCEGGQKTRRNGCQFNWLWDTNACQVCEFWEVDTEKVVYYAKGLIYIFSGRNLILFGENLICNFPPNCSCRILFKLLISLRIQPSNHLLKVTSFIFNCNTIPFTCLKNNNNIFLFSHLRLRTSILSNRLI